MLTQSRSTTHPLEPLDAVEVAQAVNLLKSGAHWNSATRIISVSLREPLKQDVATWQSGRDLDRRAAAVCFDNSVNRGFVAELNLSQGAVANIHQMPPGAQPTMSIDEQIECERAVLKSKEFIAALKKHYGDVDPGLVMVDIWSAGNYGATEEGQRRLARPLCFL